MKKISLKDITNAGFEIIEGVDDCFVTAPIDMTSVDIGMLSDLDIGTYDIIPDKQEIELGRESPVYIIYKNGISQDELRNLDEVKEYFEKYFEEHSSN